MAVELYHFWSSVCSVKARMALEEKEVRWESRYTDIFEFEHLTPKYLALNPNGVVPTLVHDGESVHESSIIIEYIDEAFEGPPLKPDAVMDRARMREFIRICDDKFPAIVFPTFIKYILPKLKNRWGEDELKKQAERRPTAFLKDVHGRGIRGEISDDDVADCHRILEGILDNMEHMIVASSGPWLMGARLTLADIAIAPFFQRLLALGRDDMWAMETRPSVSMWFIAIAQRQAFQTATNWPDESGGGYEEVGLTTKR